MIDKYVVSGIEKVLIGPASASTTLTNMIDITDHVVENSLVRTKNNASEEKIYADGKKYEYTTFTGRGEPDTIALSLLSQNPQIEALLSNILYTAATSAIYEMADRKMAKIAMKIVTKPQEEGRKLEIIIPNISASEGRADGITFNNIEKLSITGSINTFYAPNGEKALLFKQWVDANGNAINGTAPTVSAGSDTTASTNPKSLTGTATAAGSKTITQLLWTQVSGPSKATIADATSLTCSVSGLITGVYYFQLSAKDSAGVVGTSTVKITATIA